MYFFRTLAYIYIYLKKIVTKRQLLAPTTYKEWQQTCGTGLRFIPCGTEKCSDANKTAYLREVSQHFRHLVSSLPTAHVDDDVTVGVLGQRLWDDGLATAEGARDGSGSSLHASEKVTTFEDVPLVGFMYLVLTHIPGENYHLKRWQPLRMYLWWGLCTLYLHLCQVRITIWKGDNLWGCTSGGVYLPCTDTHTRWELPSERVTIFEDVPLVEFMYLVFTRMPGENCHLKGWRYLRTYLWC